MNELHIPVPGHNLASSKFLDERQESEPCSAEQERTRSGSARARQFRTLPDPVCYTKEIIPLKERKWKSTLACESFKSTSLSTAISKFVMIKMSEKLTERTRVLR